MNARERVWKALHHEKPDRMPFEISWGAFTPSLMQVYREKTGSQLPPDEYFDFDTRSVDIGPTTKKTDFSQYYSHPLPDNVILNEWGVGAVPGSVEHFVECKFHPLADCETVEEVNAFAWPDMDADYRFEGMEEKILAYKSRGYVVMGELYSTLYETAWTLRGMENFLMDLYVNEEIVDAICENIFRIRLAQAKKYAQLGVDILRLGDDVATQNGPLMSKELYGKFFKGRMQKLIQAVKEINPEILVFRHCDGKVEDLIEDFIEEGVDILNPVQPECNDLNKIYAMYGDRLAFWGGIGTQSVMPFGSPDDVTEAVRDIQRTLGGQGALLVAPSHILEPEIPWENVLAFIEAAKNSYY